MLDKQASEGSLTGARAPVEPPKEVLPVKSKDKQDRIAREIERLKDALASGNLVTLISRVAYILNHYSETRNSDMALKLKYWHIFQGFTGSVLDVERMFSLERDTAIARARAKIQNEYKLFPADDRITQFRKGKEETEKEIQIASKPGVPTVNIFADESGKTGGDKFMVIGGLWVLSTERLEELRRHFINWRELQQTAGVNMPKEFHFTEMKRQQLDIYKELMKEAVSVMDMMGFKSIVVDIRGSSRPIDKAVYAMYYQHVHHGIEHEVSAGRITLPRLVNFWKDKEDGNDKLFLNELEQHLVSNFKTYFEDKLMLNIFSSVSSIANIFIQLADLYTGCVSRILKPQGRIRAVRR